MYGLIGDLCLSCCESKNRNVRIRIRERIEKLINMLKMEKLKELEIDFDGDLGADDYYDLKYFWEELRRTCDLCNGCESQLYALVNDYLINECRKCAVVEDEDAEEKPQKSKLTSFEEFEKARKRKKLKKREEEIWKSIE